MQKQVLSGYTTEDVTTGLEYPTADGYVKVTFRVADAPTASQDLFTPDKLEFDLTSNVAEVIVPGSVMFNFCGKTYIDDSGSLYIDVNHETGVGTFAGTIDYSTGAVNINSWEGGCTNGIELLSMMTDITSDPITVIDSRVPSAPVLPNSFSVRCTALDGALLTGTSRADGYVEGTDIDGYINYSTGVFSIHFGTWVVAAGNEGEDWYDAGGVNPDGDIFKPRKVFANTVLYNATSQTFLPLDSEILGLDPVRLPQDGKVPIYTPGDVVVVLNDQTTVGTFADLEVTDLGRVRLAKISVKDSGGNEIDAVRYTVDLDLGTVTWVDLSTVSQPLTIVDRIEDMAVLTDVQITGKLGLSQPLTHDFPADTTLVSNTVIYGDLYATTSIPFDQAVWTGEWSDVLIGSDTAAQYNNSVYPIVVDNASCIEERWMCQFVTTELVNVIGENSGQILTGVSINADISPINPNTSQPYFTIPSAGWGSGWSAGNLIRFNTKGANAPTWLIQSIAQGDETDPDYNFCVEVRGDIDTP